MFVGEAPAILVGSVTHWCDVYCKSTNDLDLWNVNKKKKKTHKKHTQKNVVEARHKTKLDIMRCWI